jgi:hypothetical protein
MPKATIPITEKHLSKAKSYYPFECALALAINDFLREGFFTAVTTYDFFIFDSECKRVFVCRGEPEITKLMDEFDEQNAGPTQIVLDIPNEFLK